MAEKHFSQTVLIEATLTAVFNFMWNPANHQQLHPLIINIREIEEGTDEQSRPYRIFTVTDQLKMAGIGYKLSYTARIVQTGPAQLEISTTQSPGIRVTSLMTLTAEDGRTIVQENYHIQAPHLLMGYVSKQAVAAHKTMLANLQKVFAQSS